jgi:hypothetical protein
LATVSNLVKIASNDDSSQDVTQSRVTFNAINGVTYQIAVDGFAANAFGSISFHLSIPNPYPVFVTQPLSQVVDEGANVTFTVVTTGPVPQTFQWRRNGTNLNNQTSTTLNRTNVQGSDAGIYTVVASNSSGSVTSAPAILTVRTAPANPILRTPILRPGGVEVTLEGISGRNYGIDVSTNLVNWSPLVMWTNFTGSALYLDAAAGLNGNRFYRGRLVP